MVDLTFVLCRFFLSSVVYLDMCNLRARGLFGSGGSVFSLHDVLINLLDLFVMCLSF